VSELALGIDGRTYGLVDFSRLPTRCKFMAFMPQWDFLSFLATEAKKYPTFRLRTNADVIDLLRSGERVTGRCRAGATWKPAQVADFCLRREKTSSHAVVTQGQGKRHSTSKSPSQVGWA
jgi:hypothetical protein